MSSTRCTFFVAVVLITMTLLTVDCMNDTAQNATNSGFKHRKHICIHDTIFNEMSMNERSDSSEHLTHVGSQPDSHSLHRRKRSDYPLVFVTLMLVVDQAAYRKFGQNPGEVQSFGIILRNRMNVPLGKLRMKVVLADVLIWYEKNSFNISSNSSQTMADFADYNERILRQRSNHTYAQLITGVDQLDERNRTKLASSWSNSLCTDRSSSVVMLHAKDNVDLQAVTNTFSLAYSLGIDPADSNCSQCIMALDTADSSPARTNPDRRDRWTVGNVREFTSAVGEHQCLSDRPRNEFGINFCGNGVLDRWEQCDAGQRDISASKCCDPWTCRFAGNSDDCGQDSENNRRIQKA